MYIFGNEGVVDDEGIYTIYDGCNFTRVSGKLIKQYHSSSEYDFKNLKVDTRYRVVFENILFNLGKYRFAFIIRDNCLHIFCKKKYWRGQYIGKKEIIYRTDNTFTIGCIKLYIDECVVYVHGNIDNDYSYMTWKQFYRLILLKV